MGRDKKPRKTHRWRKGTVALREIRKYQKTTDHLLRKAPFIRLVREIAESVTSTPMRFTGSSLETLQEAAETYLTKLFHDSYINTIRQGRVTIHPMDLRLARFYRGEISEDEVPRYTMTEVDDEHSEDENL